MLEDISSSDEELDLLYNSDNNYLEIIQAQD